MMSRSFFITRPPPTRTVVGACAARDASWWIQPDRRDTVTTSIGCARHGVGGSKAPNWVSSTGYAGIGRPDRRGEGLALIKTTRAAASEIPAVERRSIPATHCDVPTLDGVHLLSTRRPAARAR